MTKKTDISIVIPCYNGFQYLEPLYKELNLFIESSSQACEVVLVDDGSKDKTWKKIEELSNRNSSFVGLKLTRNYGQHNATLAGLRKATGKTIVTMDCDLQHPPSEIPKLLKALNAGKMLVYGQYDEKKHGILQNMGSYVFNKILCDITGTKKSITSFRAFSKETITYLKDFDNPRVVLDILLSQVISPKDIEHVTIKHRATKGSTYTLTKLIGFALDMLFNYSTYPLRLASFAGIFLSGISFIVAIFYAIQYALGNALVPGFTSLILTVTFLSGIILFVLGIFGEYLGRIFMIATKRPQYKVAQATKLKEE